ELHALRTVADGLLLGPARRRDARAQPLDFLFGHPERERPDCGLARDGHGLLLSAWRMVERLEDRRSDRFCRRCQLQTGLPELRFWTPSQPLKRVNSYHPAKSS